MNDETMSRQKSLISPQGNSDLGIGTDIWEACVLGLKRKVHVLGLGLGNERQVLGLGLGF